MHLPFSTFFFQTIIGVPSFYHKQWAPDYPKYVHLKYDGAIYEIRVRRHKARCYLADGLENFKRELEIYKSTTIKFFACDHSYHFDIHFTPPLDQQTCSRPRHISRDHIWQVEITQTMMNVCWSSGGVKFMSKW